MKGDSEFDVIEPFEVDDGSLDGLSPNYIFTMGVEWMEFRRQLLSGKPFTMLCLPHNRTRLVRMAERHSRFVEDRQTGCVDWVEIWVGDYLV